MTAHMVPALDMGSLALFRRDVAKMPALSREEEVELAIKWRRDEDADAAKALVCANLKGVMAISYEYSHFGLPQMDLVQEGVMGLMHAVKRFDPSRGFRLMTYAGWWIRAAMQDFILRSWSIVKLGTSKLQRKIFSGLRHAKESIAAMEGKGRAEVAAQYGVSEQVYSDTAHAFLQRDMSLDVTGEDGFAPIEALPANTSGPEEEVLEKDWSDQRQSALRQAMAGLLPRDRYVLEQRHLNDPTVTLKALAEELGVSIERVRQIEKRAMEKVKNRLN